MTCIREEEDCSFACAVRGDASTLISGRRCLHLSINTFDKKLPVCDVRLDFVYLRNELCLMLMTACFKRVTYRINRLLIELNAFLSNIVKVVHTVSE